VAQVLITGRYYTLH